MRWATVAPNDVSVGSQRAAHISMQTHMRLEMNVLQEIPPGVFNVHTMGRLDGNGHDS
jgi:hypothetical protein